MGRSGEIVIISVIFCFAAFFAQAEAIKCWQCTSTNLHQEFCDDPFKGTELNATMKTIYLKECTANTPLDPDERLVCRKVEKKVHGKEVVERSCFEEKTSGSASTQQCVHGFGNEGAPGVAGEEIVYCNTCTKDECNGAEKYTSIAMIAILIPVAVLKLISL